MKKKRGEGLKFFAEHFWKLMKNQGGLCALSGRSLTPDLTEVELKLPFKEEGRTEFSNHYLIVRPLASIARYASEQEIIDLAIEIVKCRGKERGVEVRNIRKRKRR